MEGYLRKIIKLHPNVSVLIIKHIAELKRIKEYLPRGRTKTAPYGLSPHLMAIWYLGHYNIEMMRLSNSQAPKCVHSTILKLSKYDSNLSKAIRILDADYYKNHNVREGVDYYGSMTFAERNKGR